MQSGFVGWVDFSEADQKRARDYLRSLDEGTIDELGFGVMRDMFADCFFPATSTVMTFTRYLIFVPAICAAIERMGLREQRAAQKCKELELDLRRKLPIHRRKDEVERYPSEIYWGSLKQLGIFLPAQWSVTFYFNHLQEICDSRRGSKDDDGAVHLAAIPLQTWDEEFLELLHAGKIGRPDAKGRYADGVGLDLEPEEAHYLKRRFVALAQPDRPTLMAYLLNLPGASDNTAQAFELSFNYPWDCPHPPELARSIEHARRFSMAAKGATLLYYVMLAEARQESGYSVPDADLRAILQHWWDSAREHVCQWEVEDFLTLVKDGKALRRNDREFLRQWQQRLQDAASGWALCDDERARAAVQNREVAKRPRKARLRGGRYLKQWTPEIKESAREYNNPLHLPYLLNYRSGIGGGIIREIIEALT
jgi:hypothetical protein